MVKALLGLVRIVHSSPMFELAGAAGIVAGVWLQWGLSFALMVGGALALLKSLDLAISEDTESE